MFEYFYHEILRRTIVSFGTLFNEITIKKKDDSNNVFSVIKVPLAYGPTQKFLARLEQEPSLNKPVQITLPRMSFEFIGLTYDSSRKVTTTQTFLKPSVTDGTDIKSTYMPVPYNMEFELGILCKLNEDMLQIIEQILPYFQPSYTLSVNLLDTIGEKRDIPITLDSISMQDDYDGDFSTRRALIYTLRFTAKTYLFGPVSSGVDKDIIKKVSLGFVSGDTNSVARDVVYSQTPVATKNYTGDIATLLSANVEIGDLTMPVEDASSIPAKTYITINNETLYVSKKDGNILTVVRGSYGTPISDHVLGSEIKLITEADNDLIQFGDDFGFSGVSFE